MAYRVNQTNKKTGVTYVYEAVAYWDKKKKQARNKKVCIEKLDPYTGKLIPSKRLHSRQKTLKGSTVTASVEIIGPAIVLDTICNQLGLNKLLRSCFP